MATRKLAELLRGNPSETYKCSQSIDQKLITRSSPRSRPLNLSHVAHSDCGHDARAGRVPDPSLVFYCMMRPPAEKSQPVNRMGVHVPEHV